MEAIIAGVAAALITGVIAIVSNVMISSKAAGKTEGAVQAGLGALSQRVASVEEDNRDQWKTIERHTSEIGYLQGKANGKAAHT